MTDRPPAWGSAVVRQRPSAGTVTVCTALPIGSATDPGEAAHLLEHVLFARHLRDRPWSHRGSTGLDTVAFTSTAPACFADDLVRAHIALRQDVSCLHDWGHDLERELRAVAHERGHRAGIGRQDDLLSRAGANVHPVGARTPYAGHFDHDEGLDRVPSAFSAVVRRVAEVDHPVTVVSGDVSDGLNAHDLAGPASEGAPIAPGTEDRLRLVGVVGQTEAPAPTVHVVCELPASHHPRWSDVVVLRQLVERQHRRAPNMLHSHGLRSAFLRPIPLVRASSVGLIAVQPESNAPERADLTAQVAALLHDIARSADAAMVADEVDRLAFAWRTTRSDDQVVSRQMADAALAGDVEYAHRGEQRLAQVTPESMRHLVEGIDHG